MFYLFVILLVIVSVFGDSGARMSALGVLVLANTVTIKFESFYLFIIVT